MTSPLFCQRSVSIDDSQPGCVVEWEASRNGSHFVGRVTRHIIYCGRPALELDDHSVVYPESVLRVMEAAS